MKKTLPIILMILVGCATDPNARPIQGLNPACTLYAIADCAEIQFHKSIGREQRLTAWRDTYGSKDGDGATVMAAFMAASRAGWVPSSCILRTIHDPEVEIQKVPLLAPMFNRHLITILSITDGVVTYFDPSLLDPQTMKLKHMNSATDGLYYRLVNLSEEYPKKESK